MNLYTVAFYALGAIILASTALAVFQRNLIHAVVYLVNSFLATALLFYLLGAPFLAALEVIIYSGAIMVLFLFIIMMIREERERDVQWRRWGQWAPAFFLTFLSLVISIALIAQEPGARVYLNTAVATPAALGKYLFQHYWLSIEIASFLLFIALVGALYLGGGVDVPSKGEAGGKP